MKTYTLFVYEGEGRKARVVHRWQTTVFETIDGPAERHDASILAEFGKRLLKWARVAEKAGTKRGTIGSGEKLSN